MPNIKNLKSNSERTPEQRKELAKKAGIISGEKRRERRKLKDELLILLSENDTQKRISVALIQKALQGDVKAFVTIRDTINEAPAQKIEISENELIENGLKKIKAMFPDYESEVYNV